MLAIGKFLMFSVEFSGEDRDPKRFRAVLKREVVGGQEVIWNETQRSRAKSFEERDRPQKKRQET